MTLAVCVSYGEMKHGALTWCSTCKFEPGDDPDNGGDLHSMILSDHYSPVETLEEFSARMLSGLPRPKLAIADEVQFRENPRAPRNSMRKSWFGR